MNRVARNRELLLRMLERMPGNAGETGRVGVDATADTFEQLDAAGLVYAMHPGRYRLTGLGEMVAHAVRRGD